MGRAGYLRLSQAHCWANSQYAGPFEAQGKLKPGLYSSLSLLLLAACLVCASGCNNSCVSGTWNPSTGGTFTVKTSNPPPSCTLSAANGIVHMEIGATPEATATPAPGFAGPRIAHLFVTLSGVDIHSSALAGDEDPGWQPLAPELQWHPIQIDLLADAHTNSSTAALREAVLPAGVYRQIRLRLASPRAAESALETNHCAGAGSHCAVMSDSQVRPLVFPPSRHEVRIVFEDLPGRELYVAPESIVALIIEFDPNRSWVWRSGDALLFNPVFRPKVQRPSDAD